MISSGWNRIPKELLPRGVRVPFELICKYSQRLTMWNYNKNRNEVVDG